MVVCPCLFPATQFTPPINLFNAFLISIYHSADMAFDFI
ncbi:hypothetical protein CoNPh26_CDS0134 [Staphylococcus phage S-CoN_Ph26]|nr:hypothetical protein CoNPh26_CDS0134 [Staphylococcus phage S-CoN_Ph26]